MQPVTGMAGLRERAGLRSDARRLLRLERVVRNGVAPARDSAAERFALYARFGLLHEDIPLLTRDPLRFSVRELAARGLDFNRKGR